MAVNPGAVLALEGETRVEGPDVLNELAVSLVGGVELGKLVALPVGGDAEGGGSLSATGKEGTVNEAGVVSTEDGLSTEEVLAGTLKTSVETTCGKSSVKIQKV